jgi:hypothetical protein
MVERDGVSRKWREDLPPRTYPTEIFEEDWIAPRCVWCFDAPEAGSTLCARCAADLQRELDIYRSNP